MNNYFRYWGKAKAEDESASAYHLLPYHCLDVAAVGHMLLEKNPHLLNQFANLSGIKKEILRPVLLFFLALHDLGKFSESFQNIKPVLLKQLQGIERSKKLPYSKKEFGHDSIGFLIWKDVVFGILTNKLEIDNHEDWKDLLNWFMEASNGHHGLPPKQGNKILTDYYKDSDTQAVESFVNECLELFKIEELFITIDVELLYDDLFVDWAKFSWALTGFYVLCDWIGSGETFEYCDDTSLEIRDYFEKTALPTANSAIKEAGILPCKVNGELDPLKQLLDLPEGSKLTPLQELVKTIDLPKQPQLFIIEDETGAGKTEASLILLNRLLSRGLAQGFYLALPTMATADGIYPRVKKTYGKLYEKGQKPSLVLSHSSAKLSKKFTDTILYSQSQANQQQYEDDAQSRCMDWLADNRKKSLLAHVGVGTIDQTFLAVLKVKYQSLRLIGLLGKVLVIDEAHAYDAYMGKELEVLLEVHAAMGGTAIVMSATLPFNIRKKLGVAFLKGLGIRGCPISEYKAYPLLTHISADRPPHEIPCKMNPQKQKKAIHYEIVHDETCIYDLIKESLAQNKSVCWIRNCVRDARSSYKIWAGKHDKVDLFHARFVLADRLSVQEKVMQSFGKASQQKQRQGRLLIATQVVEQSLDLDFDVMITDLAPIDLMLQRAGRLHRHIRDINGNPKAQGKDERAAAVLTIHAPEINENPDINWLSEKFPNAKKVYSNHALLWVGLMALNNLKEKIIPKNIRPLVESVYGEECEIPKGLEVTDIKAEGNASAERSHAGFNTIDYERGYTMDGQVWAEDLSMPTRLGEDTITLTLAKWQEGQFRYFGDDDQHAWRRTEIRALKKHIHTLPNLSKDQQLAFDAVKNQLPSQGKWTNLLPMEWNSEKELWQGMVMNDKEQATLLFYHSKLGLLYAYEIEQLQTEEQLEMDGFI